MEKKSKIFTAVVFVIILAFICAGCGASQSVGNGDYTLKYEWPEKPKVGDYILKVNLVDKTGASVEGADIIASYDMPSMRGAHATTETMKRNARGDYLLPIHFAMRGDWEIVLSARKDGVEIVAATILLDI